MNTALPISGHYTFEDLGATLRLTCPYRKEWPVIGSIIASLLMVLLWPSVLIALFLRLSIRLTEVSTSAQLVLCASTAFLLAVLAFVVLELLWQLIGKEVIEISDDTIAVHHQILGHGIANRVRANEIKGLFVSEMKTDRVARWMSYGKNPRYVEFTQGKVAFNYQKTNSGGATALCFGTSLDEVEASEIVSIICRRFPQYVYKSRQ